jgi:hypothetical protein
VLARTVPRVAAMLAEPIGACMRATGVGAAGRMAGIQVAAMTASGTPVSGSLRTRTPWM